MGEAYKIPLNWERVLTLSRNTSRECVFLNLLPTTGTMMGPRASGKVFQEYLEKPNLFMLILGESGAGNIISSL